MLDPHRWYRVIDVKKIGLLIDVGDGQPQYLFLNDVELKEDDSLGR